MKIKLLPSLHPDFLKRVINLLDYIVKQHNWLVKNHKGYIESAWAKTEIKNINYAKSRIVSANQAKAYIERKETALRYLIPATNKKRHDELTELIETSLN